MFTCRSRSQEFIVRRRVAISWSKWTRTWRSVVISLAAPPRDEIRRLLPPALPGQAFGKQIGCSRADNLLKLLVVGDGLEHRHPALETAARRGWAPAAPLCP